MCTTVPRYLECYSYSGTVIVPVVKIRCQETGSGGCNRLGTLVFAAVNSKLRRTAGSAVLFVITS
jgi:hypothetical protein